MENRENRVKTYGILIGVISLAAQHGIYLLANEASKWIGNPAYSPKIGLDFLIPILPIFILPYVWAYAFWAMAPMAVSKCEFPHFLDYLASYLLACFAGAVIIAFAPTYMDRVAEGLMDRSQTGWTWSLMRFWYSLDGGDRAYNLLPSFHCINSTVSYLGVARRREIPLWFRVYSFVMMLLIFASTVFVKQHFILDVVTGAAIGAVAFFVCKKGHLGRVFLPLIRKK